MMGGEFDEMHPPFYFCQLRNGQPAIDRALTNEEAAPPWGLLGFRNHSEKLFQYGDPELWQITGRWREDNELHPFDIVIAGGVVNFGRPSAGTPPDQAPLPEGHPAQATWIETAIRDYLKTHAPL